MKWSRIGNKSARLRKNKRKDEKEGKNNKILSKLKMRYQQTLKGLHQIESLL
jgi:hypothetical protein